ncbi:hypothetical protein FSARC_10258 [Fusarium sarcochroum]|uniref:Uncharacterized protein n=1 Tax=Fusarium sarcochroum TaxID=1208366 RepID=A0A8H4TNG0_9HYPO|nr:hypothetical protein FSARC_10258 [Fusarium sarcochroum]
MASNSSDDAEILVHITAPSRSADDVLYRQLAQAYLAFQPQKRTSLPLTESPTNEQECAVPERDQGAPSPSTRGTTSFRQSFEITSQDLSFEGALDNRSSPRLSYTGLAQDIIPSSDDAGFGSIKSWCAPPSQISDSYPMPDAGLLNVSPSRILQRYIGIPQSSQASLPSSSPTLHKRRAPISDYGPSIDVPSSLPVPSQDESLPIQIPGFIEEPNNVIPTTPQADNEADVPIPSANTEMIAFEQLAPDITHISGSVVSSHSPTRSPRAGSEPPPAKRSKISHIEHGELVRSSSDTGPALSTRNSQVEHISSSLEIRPPSPSVGIDDVDPSDLISEKLAKLARDLSSRYRPTAIRDVDPFERGYWLLDCTDWSPAIRFDTWGFLSNYLRSGLAGWGTWCRRDKAHDWIRLYCWGHVAKHTYLLLYLASGRQVKTSGASWYGADGEVVLKIPPYEKQ